MANNRPRPVSRYMCSLNQYEWEKYDLFRTHKYMHDPTGDYRTRWGCDKNNERMKLFLKISKKKEKLRKKVPSLFFFVISFSGARRKFFYIPLHLFIHSTTQGFLTWPKNSYFCRIPSAILGSIHGITLSIFSHTINHSKVIGLQGVWNLQNTRESSWETVGKLRRNP